MGTAAGCAGGSDGAKADPVATARDDSAWVGDRERAIREGWLDVERGLVDRAEYRESVKKIAWRASEPGRLRIVALESLLEDDPADTERMVALMLPRDPQWMVIGWIAETAAERGWTSVTPALVRSWSRPVIEPKDDERPERRAIERLHPGVPVERVVFDVFAAPSDGSALDDKRRADAWALLGRIDPEMRTTTALLAEREDGADDPMTAALRAAARDLHSTPSTSEQLEWLMRLREPEREAFWKDAAEAVAALRPEQREGLQLRHAAAIRWAARHEPSLLSESREDLLRTLERRFAGRDAHTRNAETPDGGVPTKETIRAWRNDLSWADALTLEIADRAISDGRVVAELFRQADDDRRDSSTEHGGVLDAEGSGFFPQAYAPRPAQRLGDNRFVASPELLEASTTALFHYHFHARSASLRDYAGPGPGDLDYANNLGRSCLVFTFITSDALNVDYYQPGGARIDLGTIRRP